MKKACLFRRTFLLWVTVLVLSLGSRTVAAGEPPLPPPSPTNVSTDIRFLMVTKQTDGSVNEAVVSSSSVNTMAGRHGSVSLTSGEPDGSGAWETKIEVSPDVNSDGTITLHILWRENSKAVKPGGERTRINHEAAFTRRTKAGAPVRVELLNLGRTAYVVEATATIQNSGSVNTRF